MFEPTKTSEKNNTTTKKELQNNKTKYENSLHPNRTEPNRTQRNDTIIYFNYSFACMRQECNNSRPRLDTAIYHFCRMFWFIIDTTSLKNEQMRWYANLCVECVCVWWWSTERKRDKEKETLCAYAVMSLWYLLPKIQKKTNKNGDGVMWHKLWLNKTHTILIKLYWNTAQHGALSLSLSLRSPGINLSKTQSECTSQRQTARSCLRCTFQCKGMEAIEKKKTGHFCGIILFVLCMSHLWCS